MNFQQILTIPLYLTLVKTICKYNYIKENDNSEHSLYYMPRIVNVSDKFYIETYDESLIPIDYEDRSYSRHVYGTYIYKALITIKVFEDTNKNPLGMYMLNEIRIPDEHDKRDYQTLADKHCKYYDYLDIQLYHTLLIMDKN